MVPEAGLARGAAERGSAPAGGHRAGAAAEAADPSAGRGAGPEGWSFLQGRRTKESPEVRRPETGFGKLFGWQLPFVEGFSTKPTVDPTLCAADPWPFFVLVVRVMLVSPKPFSRRSHSVGCHFPCGTREVRALPPAHGGNSTWLLDSHGYLIITLKVTRSLGSI